MIAPKSETQHHIEGGGFKMMHGESQMLIEGKGRPPSFLFTHAATCQRKWRPRGRTGRSGLTLRGHILFSFQEIHGGIHLVATESRNMTSSDWDCETSLGGQKSKEKGIVRLLFRIVAEWNFIACRPIEHFILSRTFNTRDIGSLQASIRRFRHHID